MRLMCTGKGRTVEVGESAMVAKALLCASHGVGLMR
jgi:hypothetical protein